MAGAAVDRERWPYRMKDLCERTGLDRQTVHFYIAKGLVPEGHKTGRNMAYYGAEHLERLRLVLELKNERFLPLDTIRAVLDGEDGEFSPEQRALLSEVKVRVADVLEGSAAKTVAVSGLLRRHEVALEELRALEDLGLLSLLEVRGALHLPATDLWVVELWGSFRAAGFTSEIGFEVADLRVYVERFGELFSGQIRMLTPKLARLPADQVAELFRRGLPLINSFLARLHQAKARNFFAALD
ncbi:MerR family transcriptional regulator [Pseudenhygromyxa sp. WMMC2535]|uniref:MerR family transcriptional regulator n=1 Tax=Pseudenhygromyxa sp. WMMC2535 TaxID=2712867 RepID=UPI001551AA13|nr:MerR family transcriptional regulator [Pseudenhygromyxa sp. WMMC2535]NVB36285.1 MerR family transcriptional regulator [Pseudenhygromyxa sp. WMMC2535]